MDVLRRVRNFRRRPEKILEASLSSVDCGDLHLHHPAWYSKTASGARGGTHVSFDDLNSLSSAELGLVFRNEMIKH